MILTKQRLSADEEPTTRAGIRIPKIETVLPDFATDVIPQQPTVELERLYRKQRLAAGYRLFARAGFDMGGAGHITARDPQWTNYFWVNPAAVHFSKISVSELMLVNSEGEIMEPPRTARPILNTAAFAIHAELHEARPDVMAAAHSHSLYGKTWSAVGRLLEPLTQDSAAFYGDHAIFEAFSGVVLDNGEGKQIAKALGQCKALILRNHGILTVGRTVETAVWRYLAMENACRVQLLAEGARGHTKPMSESVARQTAAQTGRDIVGIWAFEPDWNRITSEEPDLLD